MEKPVDTAQVVLDNRGKKASQAASSGGGSSVLGLVLKSVAVLFVVCNVTALYVLHFVNHPSPTTRFSFSSFSATAGTSASVGDAVSLSSTGAIRNGAGTTAYLDRAMIGDADVTYYEYINMAKLGTSATAYSTNFMSYRRVKASSKESVLTTFTVDPATKFVTINPATTANVVATSAIRGIATLSDTQAALLVIDDSTWTYMAYVMPASIASTSATLDQSKQMLVATGSSANYMTRLNSKSVIVAYFQPYVAGVDYYQSVKVATLATDGTVSLSAATNFGPANNNNSYFVNWGKPVTISSTEGSFVIPYYTTDPNATNPGLCVTMSTYSTTTNTVAAFTTPVCTTMYKPTYFIDGIMLTDSVLMLAFQDKSKNNALTLVTVSISASKAVFRTTYVFPEVAGSYDFGTGSWGYSPELSLALLSGNRVAVSFLNPTMNGRQSVKVLKYSTESLSFKDVTPVLPVASSSFTLNINGGTTDKSVTQKILAVGNDSVIAMHMGIRGAATHQHVSLVESYGAPMGVLRHYNGKSDADVAVSGKAKDVSTKDNAKMVTGQFYYATTAGYVVTPASTTQSGAEYFTASDDAKVLVTADSKVGVAIAKDELFVSTGL